MATVERIAKALKELVESLVNSAYSDLQCAGRTGRLSVAEIQDAIAEYGGRLTLPPPEAYSEIEPIPVRDTEPQQYHVDFDLWVDGDPSDLTISCTVTLTEPCAAHIEIDDLHVM